MAELPSKRLTDGVLAGWLARAIDAGIDGIGPLKGARDLVDPLRRKGLTPDEVVDRLVRTQCGQAAVQGAVTSAGGLLTAAIGAPVGMASALLVQARLVAAIAYAHGHDLADLAVRERVEATVGGSTEAAAGKRTGISAGKKAAAWALPRVQERAASRIATRVAAGKSAGVVSSRVAAVGVSRAVPVVGALVGGAFDLVSTKRVADRARRDFRPGPGGPGQGSSVPPVVDGEVLSEVVSETPQSRPGGPQAH